jgi:hypothetical protein
MNTQEGNFLCWNYRQIFQSSEAVFRLVPLNPLFLHFKSYSEPEEHSLRPMKQQRETIVHLPASIAKTGQICQDPWGGIYRLSGLDLLGPVQQPMLFFESSF